MTNTRKGQSLKDLAYEKIANWILNDTLKPGEVITETGIAESIGISRTPVREALHQLSQEEMVTIIPRVGVFVSQLNIKSLKELFEVREAVEGMMTYLGCQKGSVSIFEDIMSEIIKAGTKTDELRSHGLEKAGDRFHAYIADTADNGRLRKIIDSYKMQLRLERKIATQIPGRVDLSMKEHMGILEACIRQAPEEAEKAMRLHIRSTLDSIISGFTS